MLSLFGEESIISMAHLDLAISAHPSLQKHPCTQASPVYSPLHIFSTRWWPSSLFAMMYLMPWKFFFCTLLLTDTFLQWKFLWFLGSFSADHGFLLQDAAKKKKMTAFNISLDVIMLILNTATPQIIRGRAQPYYFSFSFLLFYITEIWHFNRDL